jgi:ATP/maltotriose-dependent transcriptional regulator MalT
VLGDRGDFVEAMKCFDEAMDAVRRARHEVHASILGLRAAVLLWQGEWQAARERATEASRICERVRSIFTLSMGRSAALYAEWMLEGRPETLQMLLRASRWLEPRGITLFRSWNHGWLADGFASCGNVREARTHATLAMRRGRQSDHLGGAMACRAMARLAAQEGDAVQIDSWLARARAIARTRDSAHEEAVNDLCESEIAFGQSRTAHGHALLDAAEKAFTSMAMPAHGNRARLLRQRHSPGPPKA